MVEPVQEKDNLFYEFVRVIANILFRTLLPVRIHGGKEMNENVPPYVIIANHQHALDPVVMGLAVKKHQCVFLGKKELGKNKLARYLLAKLHCILVDRGHTDMEAMRACMKAVNLNKPLVIFPEGTRHHEGQMEYIENGTALIALRSKAPIIPMYFDRKMRFFRLTHLYIGDPIPTQDLLQEGINTETCEKMNERMRETFREMIQKYGHFDA